MEFTLQSYEILIIGLMVMGLFLAVIPVRPMDARLKGYRISLIFMALSFVFLGTYCVFKARLPRELLFIPFFVSSHIQVCLLGLAHLNLLNLNIFRRKQVLLNFSPMLVCAAVYLTVQLFCPFVRLTSWSAFFHSLSNPGVVVRVIWLFVYIGQIIYYAVVFFRQEKIYSRELGDVLSDAPDFRYRLALFSFIGALLAGFDSVCICLTLDKFWGGLFNLIMLALYAVMVLASWPMNIHTQATLRSLHKTRTTTLHAQQWDGIRTHLSQQSQSSGRNSLMTLVTTARNLVLIKEALPTHSHSIRLHLTV